MLVFPRCHVLVGRAAPVSPAEKAGILPDAEYGGERPPLINYSTLGLTPQQLGKPHRGPYSAREPPSMLMVTEKGADVGLSIKSAYPSFTHPPSRKSAKAW